LSSLSEHLYNKAHGRIFKASVNVTDHTTTGDAIYAPPSGKKVCLTHITFSPKVAGDAVTIKVYESDGTTLVESLFTKITVASFLLTVPSIDMSDCPIILTADRTLRGIVAASGDEVYVTVRGFLL